MGDAVLVNQRQESAGIEALAAGDDVRRTVPDRRQQVQAAAVGQGRSVRINGARADLVDIGVIVQRHGQQVAMGQGRALRPPVVPEV